MIGVQGRKVLSACRSFVTNLDSDAGDEVIVRSTTRNPSDRITVRLEIAGEEKYSQLAMPRVASAREQHDKVVAIANQGTVLGSGSDRCWRPLLIVYVGGHYDTWDYLPVACFLTFISRS